MKDKNKPKYNMWQSIKYMLATAWKNKKSVIAMVFIMAILQVRLNLAQLYIAPMILNKVEAYAPFAELL